MNRPKTDIEVLLMSDQELRLLYYNDPSFYAIVQAFKNQGLQTVLVVAVKQLASDKAGYQTIVEHRMQAGEHIEVPASLLKDARIGRMIREWLPKAIAEAMPLNHDFSSPMGRYIALKDVQAVVDQAKAGERT